eukprot:4595233-Pleurochrysis_carterae.AAC.2
MAMHVEMAEWGRASAEALQKEKSSSTCAGVDWWLMSFPLWDAIPSEFIIKNPRLVWDRLYVRAPPLRLACTITVEFEELYVSEMEAYSVSQPL